MSSARPDGRSTAPLLLATGPPIAGLSTVHERFLINEVESYGPRLEEYACGASPLPPCRSRLAVGSTILPRARNNASATSNYGPTGAVPAVGTKIQGGTAYFEEGPAAPPTYIFPMISPQVCSTMNYGQFTYLMYRPLYWFGNNNSPTVDYNYSVGNAPAFSNGDKTVTVTLKNWKWSNGESVTSRDVEFWMNMMDVEAPKFNWCDYTPGYFPDNVASIAYPNAQTVVFHLKTSVNPTWFLYNELSQVTPMPIAWDRTSASGPTPTPSTPNLPDTTPAGAAKVYTYLNGQATNVASYASSPLWSVVDGPWKLQSFTTTGEVTFVPNPDYSGSPKPTLSKFVEVPFTSDEAGLNEVKSGGPNALSMAELPDEYLPQLKSIEGEGYNAVNFTDYSISYFPLNLGNPTFGPVFRQLYFRQAFQHLVDANGWLEKILGGYAVPTNGPVPTAPFSPWVDNFERNNPYPFSISDATNILKSHGWTNVGSGQVATCAKPGSGPGECGAGVPKGLQLKFNLLYQSGSVITSEETDGLEVSGLPGRDRHRADDRPVCAGRGQGDRLRAERRRPVDARPSAPGQLSTGGLAGSTPLTTCPPARRSLKRGPAPTSPATATPRRTS